MLFKTILILFLGLSTTTASPIVAGGFMASTHFRPDAAKKVFSLFKGGKKPLPIPLFGRFKALSKAIDLDLADVPNSTQADTLPFKPSNSILAQWGGIQLGPAGFPQTFPQNFPPTLQWGLQPGPGSYPQAYPSPPQWVSQPGSFPQTYPTPLMGSQLGPGNLMQVGPQGGSGGFVQMGSQPGPGGLMQVGSQTGSGGFVQMGSQPGPGNLMQMGSQGGSGGFVQMGSQPGPGGLVQVGSQPGSGGLMQIGSQSGPVGLMQIGSQPGPGGLMQIGSQSGVGGLQQTFPSIPQWGSQPGPTGIPQPSLNVDARGSYVAPQMGQTQSTPNGSQIINTVQSNSSITKNSDGSFTV